MGFEQLLNPSNPFLWVFIVGIVAGAGAVLARPFYTYVKFVYPNAKFEAIGNPFINSKHLEGLLQSKTLDALLETINAQKDYALSGSTVQEIQQALDAHFFGSVEMMRKDSTTKLNGFYDAFLYKYDLHLIKQELTHILIRNETSDTQTDSALLQETQKLFQDIHASEPEQIPSALRIHGYPDNLVSIMQEEDGDPQLLQATLDIISYQRLQDAAVPYKCAKGKQQLVRILRDVRNVKNLLRTKHLSYEPEKIQHYFMGEGKEIAQWKYHELAEVQAVSQVISGLEGTSYYEPLKNSIDVYNKEHSIQYLETVLDTHSIHLIRDLSQQHYVTIGPTIRFLISKEYEIQNLKAIVKGIAENLPRDRIQRLLVMEDA